MSLFGWGKGPEQPKSGPDLNLADTVFQGMDNFDEQAGVVEAMIKDPETSLESILQKISRSRQFAKELGEKFNEAINDKMEKEKLEKAA